MRIYPSPIVMDEQKPTASAPLRRRHRHAEVGNVSACAKFPRERALLPHHGLADAITSDHMFTVAIAAGLLRSDGNAMGTTRKHPSLGRTERIRLIFYPLSNGFAAAWTIFQDTPIVRFRSCCATFASVLQ